MRTEPVFYPSVPSSLSNLGGNVTVQLPLDFLRGAREEQGVIMFGTQSRFNLAASNISFFLSTVSENVGEIPDLGKILYPPIPCGREDKV